MVFFTFPRLVTVLAGAAGAAILLMLNMPLPILLGPIFGCLLAALMGVKLQDMGGLGTVMRTFLGVAIGSTVTPELIRDLPNQAPTLALVPLFVLTIGLIGYPFLRKFMGYDHPTAFYAAMPGGLQDMLIFGEEAGGNVRTMSLIHATRVIVIVTGAPILLTYLIGINLTRRSGAMAADLPPGEILIMIAAGVIGWQIARRVGMFGASILGPLILTAILSLTGVINSRPPVEMIWAAQFFIGMAVGAKYTGITGRELRTDVLAGVVFALIMALVSTLFILAILRFSPADSLDVWLAFLPGGQAEMALIAFVIGADVAFVVTHHLLRIFTVILLAPVVARFMSR